MKEYSSLHANKLHLTYRDSLLELAEVMAKHAFLSKKEQELRALAKNLQSPFNIAVFGEVNRGKSSLINALIGKQLSIVANEETTAILSRISYATGNQLNTFTVHWKDAPPESFPLAVLREKWVGKTKEVESRTKHADWLDLYSDAPVLNDIHITDSPGTNSVVDWHEDIAKQFINGQQADAMIYVFSPSGKNIDKEDLETFKAGCLEGSSMDNSVAVLHKWDDSYWNDDKLNDEDESNPNCKSRSIMSKAKLVHEFMKDKVSVVIPVSAPLGLIAKTAPASFWQECRNVLKEFTDIQILQDELADPEIWNDSQIHEYLLNQSEKLGCPWMCFRVLMRHLYRHPEEDAASVILELSGILKLEEILDKQIFSVRSVIQQKQNCARARKLLDDAYQDIEKERIRLKNDIRMMEIIYRSIPSTQAEAQRWIDNRCGYTKIELQKLDTDALHLDITRNRIRDWVDSITYAHDLIPWLKDYKRLNLEADIAHTCIAVLQSLLPGAIASDTITIQNVVKVLPLVNSLALLPDVTDKHHAEKLRKCIMAWCTQNQ